MKRYFVGFLAIGAASLAHAGLNMHTSQGSFNAAVSGYVFMGLENWDSGVGSGTVPFNDSLLPGVANGPMPFGTNASMGITVQSNTLGNNPTATSPGGANGLAFYSGGSTSVGGFIHPSNQGGSNLPGSSFDIILSTVGGLVPKGIDLTPIYMRGLSTNNFNILNVRVYDSNNVFLGSISPSNVQDSQEGRYLGFDVTGSTTIGRINIAVDHSNQDMAGADNIRVFGTVPEPASVLTMAIGLAALARRRRR